MIWDPQRRLSRRDVVTGAVATGTAALLGMRPETAVAEPPLETTTIRLIYDPDYSALCYAPMFVASRLLAAEGFSDVRYVKANEGPAQTVGSGRADVTAMFPPTVIKAIDRGIPIVVLMGIHSGCTELFGTERVNSIRDLRGRRVLSDPYGIAEALFLADMLAYVGMNPRKDVQWVPHPPGWPEASIKVFAAGSVDAMTATPPLPQMMRARKVGHVVVNTVTDAPWSQYTCCLVCARREFIEKYPVATKRTLRAIVKAAQVCTSEPERAARFLVDAKFNVGTAYPDTLQSLRDMRYGPVWRDYDAEASLLFHALRMRENGFIKSTPQKIVERGTDWRFLNELKKELKAWGGGLQWEAPDARSGTVASS